MNKSFIYRGDYKSLKYQSLKLNDTKEHIVWIYDKEKFYYRCYGLPDTISFCEKALLYLNREKTINELLLIKTLNNKEKLIIQNLNSFSEALL